MAVCRFVETPATPEQYDQVMAKVTAGGASTEGRTVHIAAVGDDGRIRIFDVWDSSRQAERSEQRCARRADPSGQTIAVRGIVHACA